MLPGLFQRRSFVHCLHDSVKVLHRWTSASLDLLFPPVCQICLQQPAGKNLGYVCACCRKGIGWVEPPFCRRCGLPYPGEIDSPFECSNCNREVFHFEWARASVVISNPVLEVIHRYKYQRHTYFEPFLAELLIARAQFELHPSEFEVIVPVPLHPVRRREREFNQAERLALHLSRATGIPMNASALQRVQPTRTQTALSRKERHNNVRNAFEIGPSGLASGSSVVLVDDVMTTGATTNACARALRAAGAGRVVVWTLARGLVASSAPAIPVRNPPSTSGLG